MEDVKAGYRFAVVVDESCHCDAQLRPPVVFSDAEINNGVINND